MTFFIFQKLSAAGREGTECNTLIYFDIVADFCGLADNYSGAVVDKEVSADSSAGVDIYTCFAVCVLGHDTRYERDTEQVEFMGDTVNEYREKSGV